MNKNSSFVSIIIRLGISLGITLAVSVAVLLLATFVAYKTDDPTGAVKNASLISLAIVSVIGGGAASRLCDRNILPPVAFSVICGVVYSFLLFLLTVIPVSSGMGSESFPRILVYLAVVILFTLGGVIFRPRYKKKLPYKKRIRR